MKSITTKPNKRNEMIFLVSILVIALIFYAVFIRRTSFLIAGQTFYTLIEDAMISMRYAKHLANGYGLVWNIGEAPVQGFTNFGWTLFMALLRKFPFAESKISLAVMMFNSILLLGNAYLTYKLTKIITPNSVVAPKIALIITAFYYPLVFWSLRGMEVGVTAFLVLVLVKVVLQKDEPISIKKSLLVGLLAFLAILTRIDSLLQVGVVLSYILYKYAFKHYSDFWKTIPIWILFLGGFAGILLFQYFYFGSVFPNTYYLRVEGVSYATRFNSGLQTLVGYSSRDFNILLFFVMAGLLIFKNLRNNKVALFLALFFIQCLYSIYVGGDYSEPIWSNGVNAANRFVSLGILFLIILFSITIERFIVKLNVPLLINSDIGYNFKASFNTAVLVGFSALIVISGEPWFEWAIYNAPGLRADIRFTKLAFHIREYTDDEAVIAVHAAGQVPYYSDRNSIDLLGKNDPFIAKGLPVQGAPFYPGHNKWNYEYSISTYSPDIIAPSKNIEDYCKDNGYTMLENGIWVRNDSELIDFEGLNQSYED